MVSSWQNVCLSLFSGIESAMPWADSLLIWSRSGFCLCAGQCVLRERDFYRHPPLLETTLRQVCLVSFYMKTLKLRDLQKHIQGHKNKLQNQDLSPFSKKCVFPFTIRCYQILPLRKIFRKQCFHIAVVGGAGASLLPIQSLQLL